MRKNFKDLKFTDDFMFCHVMQNNEKVAKGVIESILGYEIGGIVKLENQKSIQITNDGHGVRFDIYLKDDQNKVYDIEMQTVNNIDLRKRSRYYQSMLDRTLLGRGRKYRDLNDSFIIFIMLQDLFQLGYNVYEFENICTHNDEVLKLGDGAKRIFVNASRVADDASPELSNLISYILDGKTRDALTQSIEDSVANAKFNPIAEGEFMTWEEMKDDYFTAGKAEQKIETALRAIPAMIERGISLEDACEIQGITTDEYKEYKTKVS